MYQSIRKRIAVAGVFNLAKFEPKKFKYKSREYAIQKITIAADVKDGGVRKRFYSVVSEDNVYRLSFNRENEIWMLEEVWVD